MKARAFDQFDFSMYPRRKLLCHLAVLLLLGVSCADQDGCKHDQECKGDRVCEDRVCVDPASSPNAKATRAVSGRGEGDRTEIGAADPSARRATVEECNLAMDHSLRIAVRAGMSADQRGSIWEALAIKTARMAYADELEHAAASCRAQWTQRHLACVFAASTSEEYDRCFDIEGESS